MTKQINNNSSLQKVTISSLSHEGRGIASINNKTTFIEGALPGEEVSFTYCKKHSKYDEGIILEIISASPDRVIPHCPHFSICGGCNLQHLHTTQQILFKQNVLLEQLKHFGNLIPQQLMPPLTGPEWGYRYKARLSVKYVDKKNALLIGFHEKNGRYVADLSCCPVLHPSVGQLIEPLKKMIMQLSIYRQIPQIEVAIADNFSALIFRHLSDMTDQDIKQLVQFAQQYHFQIYLQPNSPLPLHCIWPENNQQLLNYSLADHHLTLEFKPNDFTQINPIINQKMINSALQLLDLNSADIVLDLFCGIGNFTLPIAKYAKSVVGVEGAKSSVERAIQNALNNSIDNAQFYVSNLIDPKMSDSWAIQKYNKILLDPPRTGALEIIKHFASWQPQKIVYVSCNPATLARDAGELAKQGYRLIKAGVMDMFPHTKHVESMALFEK